MIVSMYLSNQDRKNVAVNFVRALSTKPFHVYHPTLYHPKAVISPIQSAIRPFGRLPPPKKHPRLIVCLSSLRRHQTCQQISETTTAVAIYLMKGGWLGWGTLRPPLEYTFIRLCMSVAPILRQLPRLGFDKFVASFFAHRTLRV